MSLDVESLLQEISPEAPCGEDIGYDPEFMELETLTQGTPDSEETPGGEEPNWSDIKKRCMELLGRSKNLRVMVYLAVAQVEREGIPGFRDALALIHTGLERYWDTLYPQLDPDDNNDPLERINIISSLALAKSFQDPLHVVDRVMAAPLCDSKGAGSFSLLDLQYATGKLAPAEGSDVKVPDLALVHAAFEDTDLEALQDMRQAAEECVEHATGIDAFLTQTVGVSQAPNLDNLVNTLKEVRGEVEEALERRGYGTGEGTQAAGEGGDSDAGGAAVSAPGNIANDQDVLRTLDKIMSYYERKEPSSPVPLMLKRAKRLVGRSFVDIIRDLSPDAMSQVRMVSGETDEGE